MKGDSLFPTSPWTTLVNTVTWISRPVWSWTECSALGSFPDVHAPYHRSVRTTSGPCLSTTLSVFQSCKWGNRDLWLSENSLLYRPKIRVFQRRLSHPTVETNFCRCSDLRS